MFLRSAFLSLLLSFHSASILKNPSFEYGLDNWNCKERPNLWNIVEPSKDRLSTSSQASASGSKSLRLQGSTSAAAESAVFASQFVSTGHLSNKSNVNRLLIVKWASLLKMQEDGQRIPDLYSPYILVDLQYSDDDFFFIKQTIPTDVSSDFQQNCVQVPSSRPIKALMVTLVAEGPSAGTDLFIDHVSVEFASNSLDFDSCPLYENSFPVWRPTTLQYLKRSHDSQKAEITLATQLTLDRLSSLERLAKVWMGPISAAVLLFRQSNGPQQLTDQKSLKELIQFHQSSLYLSKHVDVHVVLEDSLNGEDSSLYPVNFLRNLAIRQVTSDYVYYVDVDILPSMSEERLRADVNRWRNDVDGGCVSCAFITPVFTSKDVVDHLPAKKGFLEELQKPDSSFKAFAVVSHSIVNYHKWYGETQPYEVTYRENVEPYFVVQANAPAMNAMFVGYGRDKCSYSRELNGAGYKFFVLPEVYAVNLPEKGRSQKSILSRNFGGPLVRLRVFLNTIFQDFAMHQRYEKGLSSDGGDESGGGSVDLGAGNQKEQTSALLPVYGMKCDVKWRDGMKFPDPPGYRQMHHQVAIIDGLVKEFGPKVFVRMGPHQDLTMMILMHWDTLVALQPGEYIEQKEKFEKFLVTFSGGDIEGLIDRVNRNFASSKLYWLKSTDTAPGSDDVFDLVEKFLTKASDHDILALDGLTDNQHKLLLSIVCKVSSHWTVHQRGSAVVVRTAKPIAVPAVEFPPIPPIALEPEEPHCSSDIVTTDVVLFTRDRPVQTLAFLESLISMGSGVNKVWILYRSDDDVFEEGYKKAVKCLPSPGIDVEFVQDKPGQFGKNLASVLRDQSTAQFVIIAVDEIIWLQPFNITKAACLMKKSKGTISTTQLRLGKNLAVAGTLYDGVNLQRRQVASTKEFELLFPYRLPYDFGYVTNVDGVLIDRKQFIEEMGSQLSSVANPSGVEGGWIWEAMMTQVRHWHLMPNQAKLLNNVLKDGRILNQKTPGKESHDMAENFLKDGLKVDVAKFLQEKSAQHRHTHETFSVTFVKADCL